MRHILSFNNFKILIFFSLFAYLCAFSYGQSPLEVVKIDTFAKPWVAKAPLPKLRIGAQIGYSYRFILTPNNAQESMKDYIKKLRSNLGFGADISYYFNNYIGLGLKYNGISSNASTPNFPYLVTDELTGNIETYYALLSERIGIHCVAPFFSVRYFAVPNKHCIFVNVGFGYTIYRNNTIDWFKGIVKKTGSTGAFFAEIGYDFLVTKYLAVGVQMSALIGSMKSVNITFNDITEKHKTERRERNLSHIDLTLGFRFYK